MSDKKDKKKPIDVKDNVTEDIKNVAHYDASDAQVGPIHYNANTDFATNQVDIDNNDKMGFAYESKDLEVEGFEEAIDSEEDNPLK